MEKKYNFIYLIITLLMCLNTAWAANDELKVIEATPQVTQQQAPAAPQAPAGPQSALISSQPSNIYIDPLRYTLGPDDEVQIDVMRHPELSGVYPINLEGKLQYKFVGDIEVNGLTKRELEEKLKNALSIYIISPEVNVTVTEYKSKVIYVLGEVGAPGKYYMRAEAIPIREAVVQAGLPTLSAAMRKCRIITPDKNGKVKIKFVDLYSVLYGGNLQYNFDMHAGDVLYVPCTIMAKIIRMVNPVTATVSGMAAGPTGAADSKSAIANLATAAK